MATVSPITTKTNVPVVIDPAAENYGAGSVAPVTAHIVAPATGLISTAAPVVLSDGTDANDSAISPERRQTDDIMKSTSVDQQKPPEVVAQTTVPTGLIAPTLPTKADITTATVPTIGAVQNTTTFQPRTITSNETVAGQLNSLLSSSNPYITNARTTAAEQANSRGLINSSIAAGAGERAAIESAVPIASADANTYSTSALSAQNASNTSLLNQQQFSYDSAINSQNIAANVSIAAANAANDLLKTNTTIKANEFLQQTLQNQKIGAETKTAAIASAATMAQQEMLNESNIQMTPGMSTEDKAVAINEQRLNLISYMEALSATSGVELPAWNIGLRSPTGISDGNPITTNSGTAGPNDSLPLEDKYYKYYYNGRWNNSPNVGGG